MQAAGSISPDSPTPMRFPETSSSVSCAAVEMRIKEALDGRKPVQARVGMAQETVLAAGVRHDVELFVQILMLLEERRAVSDQHVVVGHPVHDEKRTTKLVRISQYAARGFF